MDVSKVVRLTIRASKSGGTGERPGPGFTVSGRIGWHEGQCLFFRKREHAEEFVRRVKSGEDSQAVSSEIFEREREELNTLNLLSIMSGNGSIF